jgi:hypothetical protein
MLIANNITKGQIIIMSLNWFTSFLMISNSKYDVIDINSMDIDSIICTITMNYK